MKPNFFCTKSLEIIINQKLSLTSFNRNNAIFFYGGVTLTFYYCFSSLYQSNFKELRTLNTKKIIAFTKAHNKYISILIKLDCFIDLLRKNAMKQMI